MIQLRHRDFVLELRHTFRLARGDSDTRRVLMVEIEHDGLVGRGEAAPIARYGQDAASAALAVEKMASRLDDPRAFESAAERVAVAGQPAAEAAIDMALRDLAGKRLGVPLYELMGIDPSTMPVTSFTIGMDTPEIVEHKVREAEGFAVLKVKMGSEEDRRVLETVRSMTDRPVRVDANEGWTFEDALARLEWLQEMGVELVEQPLPADRLQLDVDGDAHFRPDGNGEQMDRKTARQERKSGPDASHDSPPAVASRNASASGRFSSILLNRARRVRRFELTPVSSPLISAIFIRW